MKIKTTLFLFLLLLPCVSLPARKQLHVRFILHSDAVSKDSMVFITGSIPQLGNWDPGKVKMRYAGNQNWSKEIILNGTGSIEYKYTLGSWAKEGAKPDGKPLSNLQVKVEGDRTIRDTVLLWTSQQPKTRVPSTLTGTVVFHRSMHGKGLKDRDIAVWLPPGYNESKTERYPVLYMHDGQNVFDVATAAYGAEWRMDEIMDSLIRVKAVTPAIVVGINNTADRNMEYGPGKEGEEYMNFIIQRLKPFIDSAYRTLPGRLHTWTGGASSGGTISFLMVWEHPDIFSAAICMSPAFKIDKLDLVKTVTRSAVRKEVRFYMYLGGVGLENDLRPGFDQMMEALKNKGYREGIDFIRVIDPQQRHYETAWSKRLPEALEWVMKER